jgi:hypothetical protein
MKKREPEKNREVSDRMMEEYKRTRDRYLALCRRYGLIPFDLDILSVSVSRLPRGDKIALVRCILRLIRLERELRGQIPSTLVPLTVQASELSGYLVPLSRAS